MTIQTRAGQCWDEVAFEYLGDCKYVAELMEANTDKLNYFIFPAGVELTLPEIEKKATTKSLQLPSWYSV